MNFENWKDEFGYPSDDNWTQESTLFLQINDPSRVSVIHQQLQPYTENNNKVRADFMVKEFALDHFPTMARRDQAEVVRSWTWAAPPSSLVIGSAAMGILILLVACFNLTNTTIAISSRRLKEIGIRMARLWRYYQSTTTQTFVVSITIMMVISAVVIGYKVFTAASLNPVNTLRDE